MWIVATMVLPRTSRYPSSKGLGPRGGSCIASAEISVPSAGIGSCALSGDDKCQPIQKCSIAASKAGWLTFGRALMLAPARDSGAAPAPPEHCRISRMGLSFSASAKDPRQCSAHSSEILAQPSNVTAEILPVLDLTRGQPVAA